MVSNKELYSTVNFDDWAYRTNLLPVERFLIETYLDKKGKTVEAGTAGGRILLEMQKLGFTSLHGFDFIPEYIQEAKDKDPQNSIDFVVGDATKLDYEDNSFDQVIYLMQIISSIEDEFGRKQALNEAYRILKKDGIALFSFLCLEARASKPHYFLYLLYLRFLRLLTNSSYPIQYQPWLKLGGKLNFRALLDKQPYVYWYKIAEAYHSVKAANFKILAMGTDAQFKEGKVYTSWESLMKEPLQGMLFFVCQK